MNGLDLFSGIGGISIALEPWVRTVAYCERDAYAQSVILSRIADGQLDAAPIWDDVTTLRAEMLPKIDIIFGGFPCQDISVAGLGKGLAGDRSGLFYEIVRLTKEIRPSFVFLENVPAIRTRGLEQVVKAFTEIRYDCRWTCITAASVGAPHKRERWFFLAYSKRMEIGNIANSYGAAIQEQQRWSPGKKRQGEVFSQLPLENGFNSNADSESKELRQPERRKQGVEFDWTLEGNDWNNHASKFLRMDHGVRFRGHRIKALGNSVVPLQAREAFKMLVGL